MFLIISLPKLFAFMVRKFLLPDKVFLFSVFILSTLLFVQGNVDICHNVYPHFHANEENCTLVCSLKFQHAVSSVHSDEVALCIKNSSLAVFCVNPIDCRQYHVGAYCKMIPCLCKSEDSYIFHSSLKIKKVNTCVVSAKHLSLDMPIVPFPWKTLLIVCAIVFVFAACLICLRWVSPLIRSMQAKRASRINRERQAVPLEDNARLFTSVSQQNDSTPFTYYFPQGMPRIYRASPRRVQHSHRSSSRTRYTTCAQTEGSLSGILANQDKPPPYETAIQLPPPAYEDVEQAINDSTSNNTNLQTNSQRIEIHNPDNNSIPIINNTSSVLPSTSSVVS
ncbi:uncharacterized protein LOC118199808 [Stegodyphus dumicola]|uniref:uncharacterized protein LOC118199808 n=1 Tax=Stegodyphus dumicola TaxID=202533 RepID=UPI0015AD0977|nr:uncharacterized protein LOC118199808 [Stegodyphus dumicola]